VADVFISYSKSRRQETIDLADDLEKRGFTVWWDKDIAPGETFRDVINAELARARAAIVIWTPTSVKSDWVISEVTRAHRRRVVIAVHSADLNLDDIPPPFDVVHTEPVANRAAIFAALAKMGITPSGAGTHDERGGEKGPEPAPPPVRSRRAILLAAGGTVLAGAAAVYVYLEPSRKPDGTGEPLHTLSNRDLAQVSAVAFTIDGRSLLSGSWDHRLRLWDAIGEKVIRSFQDHDGPVFAVAPLPDGNHVLSASGDGTLKLWDFSKLVPVREFKGHDSEIWSLAVLPDGRQALSGSKDATLKLWDISSAEAMRTFQAGAPVRSVAVATRDQVAVSAATSLVQSWNLADGTKLRPFEGHEGEVNAVVIVPNGLQVVSAGDDGTVRIWELASGRALRKPLRHDGKVLAVAVSPNGRTVLTGGSDGTARLWDLAGGRPLRTFQRHTGQVNTVAIAPDGRTAVTGSGDRTIMVWDLTGTGSET
jgi:WD40 repeat protein